MIGILHRYILRELVKTFVLTSIGLTLMFAMGGGLLNLLRIEQISGSDVARLLLWFIPLVASFMLPIAALLSCALVYGKLAADNELDACKASGINILRLMASAVGLALVVGGISSYLSNFKVPELFLRINEIARRDLPDILAGRLKDQGHIRVKDYVFYADNARKLEPQEAAKVLGAESPNKQVVVFAGATFVQFRDEDPVQTGTAREVLLIFDRSQEPPTIFAKLLDVNQFYHNPPRFCSVGEQTFGVQMRDLPIGGRLDLKFLNLLELFRFQRHPSETEAFKANLERFRQKVAGVSLADKIVAALAQNGEADLVGEGGSLRIRPKGKCRKDLERREARIILQGDVRVDETVKGRTRVYAAKEAELVIQPARDTVAVTVILREDVKLHEQGRTHEAVSQPSPFELQTITIPLSTVQGEGGYTNAQILDRGVSMQIPQLLQEERKALTDRVQEIRRRITSEIHSRLSMSVSTIVLVLLATGLGVALRGGHALTAFGVAFIPTIIVVLMITTGRNLGEQEHTAALGLGVMWGILGLVAILDGVVIFGFIRR